MRNMSFSKTTAQMYARTKTVTRRYGWWFLKCGDRIQAVEKGMGLKKGKTMKKICVIEIVSARMESIGEITEAECKLEGFPAMSPNDFMRMLVAMCPKYIQASLPNRIEFKYVD